jgi:hypothetical protein
MEEQLHNAKGKGSARPADVDQILELNFVPQWAKRSPDEIRYDRFEHSGSGRGGDRDRSGRSDRTRRSRDRSDGDKRRPRPSPGERRPRRPDGDSRRPRQDSAEPREYQPSSRRSGVQHHEDIPAGPINVRFLPEQKVLSGLIKKVSVAKRAFPLLELASFLMSKPGYCYVRLEIDSSSTDDQLYACELCRTVSLDRSAIEAHILQDHLDDYFTSEEQECDPPSGTFVCVAKCGLSGALLGPPNHHSYGEAVKRLHAMQYSHMSLESYRDRIELSHDPADVEKWKEQSSKSVVYRLKVTDEKEAGEEKEEGESTSMSREDAEAYLVERVIPKAVHKSRKAVVSEDVAGNIQDMAIKRAIRTEWQRESRFPIKLSFALRAAFKHRHLYSFKAGPDRGMNFVTSVQPAPLDPDTAITKIHDVLTYLREHPGCTRKDLVSALQPDSTPSSEEVKTLLQPLHWLIDRGHIIEFYNGTLAVPL